MPHLNNGELDDTGGEPHKVLNLTASSRQLGEVRQAASADPIQGHAGDAPVGSPTGSDEAFADGVDNTTEGSQEIPPSQEASRWLMGHRWADTLDEDSDDDPVIAEVLGVGARYLSSGTVVRGADGKIHLTLPQEWTNCPLLKPIITAADSVGNIQIVWGDTIPAYKESALKEFFFQPRTSRYLQVLASRVETTASRAANPETVRTLKEIRTLTTLIQHTDRMFPVGGLPKANVKLEPASDFAWQTKVMSWMEKRTGESRSLSQKFFGFVEARDLVIRILSNLVGSMAASQLVAVIEVTMREGVRRCMTDLGKDCSQEAQSKFELLKEKLDTLARKCAPKADIAVNLCLPRREVETKNSKERGQNARNSKPIVTTQILRPTIRNTEVLKTSELKGIVATWNQMVSRSFDGFSQKRLDPISQDRPSDVLRAVRSHVETVQSVRSIMADKITAMRGLIRLHVYEKRNQNPAFRPTKGGSGDVRPITPSEWSSAELELADQLSDIEETALADLYSRIGVVEGSGEIARNFFSQVLYGCPIEDSVRGLSFNWLISDNLSLL